MDNYENFNIKNDAQNNLIEEEEKKSIKNNDNEKNEIDEMYKQIILNKRMNMQINITHIIILKVIII